VGGVMKKRKNGMMTLLGFLGTLQSSCVALIIGLLILGLGTLLNVPA
jgi:hypothetical protein